MNVTRGSDGNVQTDATSPIYVTSPVEVLDGVAMDTMFTAVWNAMNIALVAGDKDTALGYLTDSAKEKYGPVFDALLPYMPDIIGSYSSLQRVSISSHVADYAINRTINGEDRIFLISFLKEDDGVWRIDEM